MKTIIRLSTLILLVTTLLHACKQNTATTPTPTPPVVVAPQAAPSITSISPMKAVSGAELTITGQNLQNAKEVKFNGQSVSVVTGTNNTTTSLTIVAPSFSFSTVQAVDVLVSTSGGLSNALSLTVAPQAEITQTPVPNGLIPGGPLSLTVSNVSGMTGIDFMDGNGVVKATIPASDFLPSTPTSSSAIPGRIMVRVPVDVSAEWIRVNTEYGHGKALRISKVLGSDGITTSNIATNVGAIVTGSISNGNCLLKYSSYCIPLPDSSRKVFAFVDYPRSQSLSQDYCPEASFHKVLQEGSHRYDELIGQVRTNNIFQILAMSTQPVITLKLEIKSDDTAIAKAFIYTGSVIIHFYGAGTKYGYYEDTYVGSMLANYDLYVYSVTTGKGMLICRQGDLQVDVNGNTLACTACK